MDELADWEIIDPQVDESKFITDFDKRFLQSDIWKLLLRKYPNDYEQRYFHWKNQYKGKELTERDIGVFKWKVVHGYLPSLKKMKGNSA